LGKLGYLAERLRCGKTTASRALEELEQKGFIGVQKVGVFGRPMGTEYYVTMHRNDVNFELPSNAFMRWTEVRTVPSQTSTVPPQVQCATKLPVQSRLRYSNGPSKPSPSTPHGTHIHLTMGCSDAGSRSAPIGSAVASEPALQSQAAAKLKPIGAEPPPEDRGSHAKRALADLQLDEKSAKSCNQVRNRLSDDSNPKGTSKRRVRQSTRLAESRAVRSRAAPEHTEIATRKAANLSTEAGTVPRNRSTSLASSR
jgi:hypothetical protein